MKGGKNNARKRWKMIFLLKLFILAFLMNVVGISILWIVLFNLGIIYVPIELRPYLGWILWTKTVYTVEPADDGFFARRIPG